MKAIKDHEKTKEQEKDLKQKLMLFDRLGDKCLTCEAEFDRMNKKQVMEWTVVVRNEQNVVRIYCPDCIKKAKEIIKNYAEKHGMKEEIK